MQKAWKDNNLLRESRWDDSLFVDLEKINDLEEEYSYIFNYYTSNVDLFCRPTSIIPYSKFDLNNPPVNFFKLARESIKLYTILPDEIFKYPFDESSSDLAQQLDDAIAESGADISHLGIVFYNNLDGKYARGTKKEIEKFLADLNKNEYINAGFHMDVNNTYYGKKEFPYVIGVYWAGNEESKKQLKQAEKTVEWLFS